MNFHPSASTPGRPEMLLKEFSERAAECVHMAERAKSENDRALLIELARAWCGLNAEDAQEPRDEMPLRH
jgi:hypothetical protein